MASAPTVVDSTTLAASAEASVEMADDSLEAGGEGLGGSEGGNEVGATDSAILVHGFDGPLDPASAAADRSASGSPVDHDPGVVPKEVLTTRTEKGPVRTPEGTRISREASLGDGVEVAEDVRIARGARLGDGVRLDRAVRIKARSVVETGVEIGPRTVVGRGARIGAGTRIGADVWIAPDAEIPPGTVILDGTRVLEERRGRPRLLETWRRQH
jgi:acetyltransferase-like isoleucine patch superfamily enzyme